MTDRIKKTEEFVRSRLMESKHIKSDASVLAYRMEHAVRLSRIAGEIARAEGMDEEALRIAGLLLDMENSMSTRGRDAARIARPFLKELGLSDETIQEICYGLELHDGEEPDGKGERTVFVRTIGDVYMIDKLDTIYMFQYMDDLGKSSGLSLASKCSNTKNALKRLEQHKKTKLSTETATRLWRERVRLYQKMYLRLYEFFESGIGYPDAE